ncbi:MAG TPA: hypothetical protein VM489_09355, partial [Burkholderiales bacterium]|nr:hypothetical protein [Burkholderiales bacterium]
MALAYPLAMPARGPRRIGIYPVSAAGASVSPFTFAQQTYVHQGERWEAELELGDMDRDAGEEWAAFLCALNGMQGTLLLGDPLGATPRGAWAGSPLVSGSHAAGVKTLALKGLTAATTGKAGDWIQFGSGSSARLHKVVQDFAADGSG